MNEAFTKSEQILASPRQLDLAADPLGRLDEVNELLQLPGGHLGVGGLGLSLGISTSVVSLSL